MRDKSLVAAFEAGKALAMPGHGRLPTDELRVSLVNYCSTVVEDHEDEITKLLLDGGLNEAGCAAFCSVSRKDCRGDAVEEAAKRQSIADILSGVNPCGNHRVIASSRRSSSTRLTGWISTQVSMTMRLPRRPRRRSGRGGRRRPRPRSCKGGGTCVRKSGVCIQLRIRLCFHRCQASTSWHCAAAPDRINQFRTRSFRIRRLVVAVATHSRSLGRRAASCGLISLPALHSVRAAWTPHA